jgi:uncharacterized protein (TIGR01777 family)
MHILIAGGSGAIGKNLIPALLKNNHEVFVLTRQEKISNESGLAFLKWDGNEVPELDFEVNAVLNLCGESIASEPWTIERMKVLRESRVKPTLALVDYIKNARTKPKVFLNGSAVGFYGNRGFDLLTENSKKGIGFLSDLCLEWEQAAMGTETRTVILRTGIVLDKFSGALPEALKTFSLGFGGYFGSGNQGFPWIHIQDEVGIIQYCLENEEVKGAVNLVSPKPISYKEFIKEACQIGHKIALPAPEFALKLVLGDRSEMLLSSQYIFPEKMTEMGYEFQFPNLNKTLLNLLG